MKRKNLTLVAALAGLLGLSSSVRALTIDYANTPGSFIVFNGDTTFDFTPGSDNFDITSGTASGLLGEMTGTFTIGTITTTVVGPLTVSTAPVTGTGTLVIHDGANTFTGTLTWVNIAQLNSFGGLNTKGTVNLTGVTYGGSNADLLFLKNAGSAANVLTFQFTPEVELATLKNGPGANQTSFSGTITAPDGGSTVMLLGFVLSTLGVIRYRRW